MVSCRQLDAPETKEGFYQAANAWWLAKKAEVDGKLPPHPHAPLLKSWARRLAWARSQGRQDLTREIEEEMAKIEADAAGEIYGPAKG